MHQEEVLRTYCIALLGFAAGYRYVICYPYSAKGSNLPYMDHKQNISCLFTVYIESSAMIKKIGRNKIYEKTFFTKLSENPLLGGADLLRTSYKTGDGRNYMKISALTIGTTTTRWCRPFKDLLQDKGWSKLYMKISALFPLRSTYQC